MHYEVDDLSIKNADLSPIRILLADSEPSKITQIVSFTEQLFRPSFRVCKSYLELIPMLKEELPDILLLGTFETFNSFLLCQECHKNWKYLPIILLSRQKKVDDGFHYFRQIATSLGAIDVVPNNLVKLDRLLQELFPSSRTTTTAEPATIVTTEPATIVTAEPATTITMQTMLTAMKEISEISNNYFGPLAQGNYWRKAHTCIIDRFPVLENWSADHFSIIGCNEDILQSPCTEQELQSLRGWVRVYITECERIIVDFGDILKNSNLSSTALQLLPDIASSPKIT